MKQPTKLEISKALEQIAKANGGVLKPEVVVRIAEDEKNILHSMFEWNESKAAAAYRIDQARRLIRSVNVVIKTTKTTVETVGYVRQPEAKSSEQGYVQTTSLLQNKDRCRAVLVAELERVVSVLCRARALAKVFGLGQELETALDRVVYLSEQVKSKSAEESERTTQ